MAVEFLLDTAAALVQGLTSKLDDMEGIHHCYRIGDRFCGGCFESHEASSTMTSTPWRKAKGCWLSHFSKHCLGPAGDHLKQTGRTSLVPYRR